MKPYSIHFTAGVLLVRWREPDAGDELLEAGLAEIEATTKRHIGTLPLVLNLERLGSLSPASAGALDHLRSETASQGRPFALCGLSEDATRLLSQRRSSDPFVVFDSEPAAIAHFGGEEDPP